MRRPLVPALVCLIALGCSHRHLLLYQAPVGTRALADKVSWGWRLTVLVEGQDWQVSSPEQALVFERKEEGGRTRIRWSVTEERWKAEEDYLINLSRGDQQLVLTIRNRSREAQVAEGVAIGVAAVVLVAALVVAENGGHGGSHASSHAKPKAPGGPRPGHPGPPAAAQGAQRFPAAGPAVVRPVPDGFPGPMVEATVRLPEPMLPAPPPEPLVGVEALDGPALPGTVFTFIQRTPQGWDLELDLRDLPRDELWTVAGDGCQVTGIREGADLVTRWTVTDADWEAGRTYDLAFQGPAATCRARIRVD